MRMGMGAVVPLLVVPWFSHAHLIARPVLALRLTHASVSLDSTVKIAVASRNLHGKVDYRFWIKSSPGVWHRLGRPQTAHQILWKAAKPGTYWLRATATSATPGHGHKHHTMVTSAAAVLYVGAETSLKASASSIPSNGSITLTAHPSHVTHPLYQFWIQGPDGLHESSGSFTARPMFSPKFSHPGVYRAVVDIKTPGGTAIQSGAIAWHVFGAPASITLAQSQKVWVADSAETETLTAMVVDAEGDVVTTYEGTGSLVDSSASGALSKWGPTPASLTAVTQGTPGTLHFQNGRATFTLQAGSTTGTDMVTATTEPMTGTTVDGTTSVHAVAQVPTAIQIHPHGSYLIANESGNPATVNLLVADQAGEPMLSGTYPLMANLAGPGQFHDLTQGPDTLTYVGGQGPTPLTIYSIAGTPGPVVLTVSGSHLVSAHAVIPSILGGQPYQMGVSADRTKLQDGESTTLTLTQLTKAGGVSDPDSLDNSGYVVTITDAAGNIPNGFTLDGASYMGPETFPVATDPSVGSYVVSQPVTLGITTAIPGTYYLVVSDADGLWKPSTPLTLTISQ